MDKRILVLGPVFLLTACSGVELISSGTEADSKVPVSIEGYNFMTPAMASSGFCAGVPAVEGPDFEGSMYSYSTFLYVKDGFTVPTSAEPDNCEYMVRSANHEPGIIRVSAIEYPEGVRPEGVEAKCDEGSDSMEGYAYCTFPEENYSYSIVTMRIGSLESQNEELSGFVQAFDKHAELNIPEP